MFASDAQNRSDVIGLSEIAVVAVCKLHKGTMELRILYLEKVWSRLRPPRDKVDEKLFIEDCM